MKKFAFLALTVLCGYLALSQNIEQELISNSGDSYKNQNYQLDWSLGEVVTETYISEGIVVTQGFHQSTLIISSVQDFSDFAGNISVYPNPTSDFLTLEYKDKKLAQEAKVEVNVTDINGNLVINQKINEESSKIIFSELHSGIYFVSITENGQITKTFKIIKK